MDLLGKFNGVLKVMKDLCNWFTKKPLLNQLVTYYYIWFMFKDALRRIKEILGYLGMAFVSMFVAATALYLIFKVIIPFLMTYINKL